MNRILNKLRLAPKRFITALALIGLVAVPAAVMAWGPSRDTYTMKVPANHVTFNSITDNPNVGDERNFVVIKDAANTNGGGWQDTVTMEPGHEYLVRLYVHNNAASNLNLVATNTRVMADVPTVTAKSMDINGFVTADNATPKQVWDQVHLQSDRDFNLLYVEGSATYYNNVFTNGTKLSDDIVTNKGALVGYNKLDGNVPGCLEYSGYVTFKVKPQFGETANFTIVKKVSKAGANKWDKNYQAKPGETVDFLLNYKNIGEATQKDVVVKDVLPQGMTYVPGSTYVADEFNPNGTKVSDNIVTKNGINIGTYATNGGAYIKLSAKVADNKDLAVCGTNNLTNTVRVETGFGYKEDTATVSVNKTCDMTVLVNACNLDTKKIEIVDEKSIDDKHYTRDLTKCATPETPKELPHTGAADGIFGAISAGAITAAVIAYVASRKSIGLN